MYLLYLEYIHSTFMFQMRQNLIFTDHKVAKVRKSQTVMIIQGLRTVLEELLPFYLL